jgi:hypothetical protein
MLAVLFGVILYFHRNRRLKLPGSEEPLLDVAQLRPARIANWFSVSRNESEGGGKGRALLVGLVGLS